MFYIDAPLSDPPPPNGTERLYSVGLDGRGRRLIATFEWGGDYLYRELLGFDERRDELIWTSETHDGAGGFFGLSATNVATGKTRSIMPRRTFFAYNQIAITADATRLYYVKDKIRLVERDLVAGSERTIYRADGASERVLEFVNVTANGSFVVFQAAEESVFSTGDQKQTITTYRIRLRDLARRTLRVDSVRPEDRVIPGLSPDGRYLFLISFSSERGRDLVVDLATGRTATLADRTKDRAARLVAWLWLPD